MEACIELGHGNGGIMTHSLIRDCFRKYFEVSGHLSRSDDSARLTINEDTLAFTTDSFVITPLFFPGGDIGKLAVCGTVNDLAVSGAIPKYLSCAFILEEGFPMSKLERIVESMAQAAKDADVQIVTGDTKVVQRGQADGVFINTSGIGIARQAPPSPVEKGDCILITGTIGDHGTSILLARENLDMGETIYSDCAPLAPMLPGIWKKFGDAIRIMKDPTRGGVATTLNEIAHDLNCSLWIDERSLPLTPKIQSVCSLLGLDPLYLANEGKAIIVARADSANNILRELKTYPNGQNSRIIGEVTSNASPSVVMKTSIGTSRMLPMLFSDPLPRIC